MERKLIANYLVPDDEVWVSPATWERPFSLKAKESTVTDTQHTQAKMPTLEECLEHFGVNHELWSDGQRLTHSYVTKVYDYICRHIGCA